MILSNVKMVGNPSIIPYIWHLVKGVVEFC